MYQIPLSYLNTVKPICTPVRKQLQLQQRHRNQKIQTWSTRHYLCPSMLIHDPTRHELMATGYELWATLRSTIYGPPRGIYKEVAKEQRSEGAKYRKVGRIGLSWVGGPSKAMETVTYSSDRPNVVSTVPTYTSYFLVHGGMGLDRHLFSPRASLPARIRSSRDSKIISHAALHLCHESSRPRWSPLPTRVRDTRLHRSVKSWELATESFVPVGYSPVPCLLRHTSMTEITDFRTRSANHNFHPLKATTHREKIIHGLSLAGMMSIKGYYAVR